MTPKLRFFVPSLLLSCLGDRLAKGAILLLLAVAERIVMIPGWLDLTRIGNPGGAFSFLAEAHLGLRLVVLYGGAVAAVALVLALLRSVEPGARLAGLAMGIMLGGVLGNLVDRMLYGEVIDFIDVHLSSLYIWPTFNTADAFAVIGIVLLAVEVAVGHLPGVHGPQRAPQNPSAT